MKITKAQFDALPADLKTAFKAVEGNADQYDNGEDDAAAAIRARDNMKAERDAALAKAAEEKTNADAKAKAAADAAAADALKKAKESGDVEALENSWREKLATAESTAAAQLAARDAELNRLLVDNNASTLAGKLAVDKESAAALLPHIKGRLKVETDAEGKTSLRVLDAEGKPTASGLGDLEKEILANPAFKRIVAASNGSGGGAPNPGSGGGAPKTVDFAKATTAEKVQAIRDQRAAQGKENFEKSSG